MSEVTINFKLITRGALDAVKKFTGQTNTALKSVGKSQETIRENFRQIRNGAAIAAASLTAGFVLASKAAAEFETGILGVSKTVRDLSDKDLKDLGNEIRQISRSTPFATTELLQLAKSAGQLGVTGKDNIILFTQTIAKLGTAANISGEEAATSLARILNVTDESTDNIDNLASAIVDLGNNFAATESEIVEAGKGIAQATAQFGVSSTEAVSFGAAVKSLGIQSELARSVFLRSFGAIRKTIDEGGKSFRDLEKITGLTGKALKDEFETNASKVFQRFLTGLNKVQQTGGSAARELNKFGLTGVRINAVLPVLSSRIDVVNDALNRGGIAAKDNTALQEEYERQANSTANTLLRLKNNINDLGIEIGESLTPIIKTTAKVLNSIIDVFRGLNGGVKDFILISAGIATASLIIVAALLTIKISFINLALAAGVAETSINLALFGIPALITLAVAALITLISNWDAVVAAIKNGYNGLKEFFGLMTDEEVTLAEFNKGIEKAEVTVKKFDKALQTSNISRNAYARAVRESTQRLDENRAAVNASVSTFNGLDKALKADIVNTTKATATRVAQNEAEREALRIAREKLEAEKGLFDSATESERADAEKETDVEDFFKSDERFQKLQDDLGREEAARIAAEALRLERAGKHEKAVQLLKDASVKGDDERRKRELANQQAFFSAATSLARSENKSLAAVGKAAAVAQIAIKTPQAVASSFAFGSGIGGPVTGFIFGAIAAAAMAAQAAQVAGLNFQQGGVVPGTSFSGDRVAANVNSGEMILNRQQQSTLFALANGQGGGGQEVTSNVTIELDGEVVGRSVSKQVANGLQLGEFE